VRRNLTICKSVNFICIC